MAERDGLQAEAARLLEVMALAERLKFELRHSWLSDGRRESVAEHTWAMCLLAVLAERHLETRVDIATALKMIVIHDLVEAIAGDAPFFDAAARTDKAEKERQAILEIERRVGGETGAEIRALWDAFEAPETPEARLAKALDHLEVQIQHNLAAMDSWLPVEHELVYTKMDAHCAHDPFLAAVCAAVKAQAEAKMRAAGIDVDAVKARVGAG